MIFNYLIIFIILLTLYYIIPAGLMYYLVFKRNRMKWEHLRVQKKIPGPDSVRRELTWSVISIAIFALYTTVLLHFINQGYTKMYYNISEYGFAWLILSPVVALFIHDTFYYFMHRLMHWKKIFRYVHLLHHRSVSPTPFAIYAFQPLETIVQFAIYPILLFTLPFHPYSLVAFLFYDLAVNTAGHSGIEFLPSRFLRSWYFRWQNAVTHHDMHHSKTNCNFGLYFNIWDRLLGTLHPDYARKSENKN